LVTDSYNKRVRILFKEPNTDKNKSSFTGETEFQNVDFADAPATVLPMRLNVMGQQGFVCFSKGSLEPIPVMAAPNATFTVTKTADTNDGACNADCSVREAVIAANNAAGADMISIPSGTFQLTIAGANENASATGDLDVLQALTITGNGAGNTIIQAGSNATNGIDKVLSINPLFNSAFATSFTGFTVRFGRNPGTFTGDGFGGGFDWEANGTGTLTVSGLTVDSNSTLDGDGGGIVATSLPVASGVISITNSTISNNDPDRTGSNSPIGGGIFVGQGVTFRLTNTVISSNNVVEAFNQGQGGGLYAFGPASSAGKSFLTGSTVSGNTAPSDGGGILSTQPIDFNSPTTISGNSSGRSGGGIFVNHSNGTTVISKATMTGNSATTNGGAIYLGTSTTTNILNMSFSRIVGNTSASFNGLLTTGGTANVENNWWGCNTGPSAAPCDTAGATAPGVVDFNPWLRYTHTASPSSIVVGQSTTLTASFLTNSANQPIAASNLDVLIGLPITFNNAVRGTISGAQATIQATGTATATFTATSAGAGSADAKVDNGTATANITITAASTTTTITNDTPDPSVVGQSYSVTASVTVNSPGSGTPTGTITVSDGSQTCTITLPATSCNLTSTTAGAKTLTATYNGDTNFNASPASAGVAHTVNPAATTTTINSNTPNPSGQNMAVTVTYSVAVNSPGAGTPTGTVTVSDGVNSCTASVAAGSCMITLTTVGMRTLTATYNGDGNFNTNTSAGVSQTVLAPTAASVEISGRVTTNSGRGISNARVTITDQAGNSRLATTSAFGYFRFDEVQAGETYVISVKSKRYSFAPQVINVTENLTDLTFTAQ
ncbi:MAG: Ig-like domain repeat protein, partial [Pyrinomonadaceae bacterium]